jgi:phthiocerol/phenolphthiocerol synthesis type-I polyketide synthase C
MNRKKIAIIGMSYRLPNTTKENFWGDMLSGRDLVTQVPSDRWAHESFLHPNKKHPGSSYTFSSGTVGNVSMFDANFFGISPREAALMDPQQRLLLEMTWEALESAGVPPSTIRGTQCGVFVGIASADYSYRLSQDMSAIEATAATGNTASISANRISYIFDLHGPSMAIDTACSSSMVAFHQACQSILSGESTTAIAGGVSLHLHPYGYIIFSKASMLSPRGRCNVFDADGDGYVRSEGGGIFYLKDYDQAVADGNQILAVVAHSAINMDGRKSGLTVPNPKAQAALLTRAYEQAGIDPADIDYLEAHGTGTAVGDPIETQAIGTALGQRRAKDNPLPIGSIKSNLGHLETASGIAGLTKAIYALQHRVVPGTINIKTLNPKIKFDEWNIAVVQNNQALKPDGKLIIGVNSFGFGGSNAHIILESHTPVTNVTTQASTSTTPATLPVVLFGKDKVALTATAQNYADLLAHNNHIDLYDFAKNAAQTREWHAHRAIVWGTNATEIGQALRAFSDAQPGIEPHVASGIAQEHAVGPVFIYSGNGSQWEGMGLHLLQDPVFAATIQEIDALFVPLAGYALEQELQGLNGNGRYERTEIAQPALFALQVGVTNMLRSRGIVATAAAGHSVGEVAAAWASGALSLKNAVDVIYQRSRLQGLTKGLGQMTAVGVGGDRIKALLSELGLSDKLSIAGINSSRGVTIAGLSDDLSVLEKSLKSTKTFYKRLDLDYAFHSPAMDAIAEDVKSSLAHIAPGATQIPFYSTVTGALLDGSQLNSSYWWNNIRQPVLFESAIKAILDTGSNIFIEVGPHPVLRSYINDGLKDTGISGAAITTASRNNDAPAQILRAMQETFIAGITPVWTQLFAQPAQFLALPTYPWQREHHWHSTTSESLGLLEQNKVHPLLGYPLKQHQLTWENQLDTALNPILADHIVGDSVIFPGTGFSEIALAAAVTWKLGTLAEIEELEIHAPLLLADDTTKLVRTQIAIEDGAFQIQSRDYASTDATAFTQHAKGRILPEPTDLLMQAQTWVQPERQPDFTAADHQTLTLAAGLTYGQAFRCISHGWIDQNTALAAFTIPESVDQQLSDVYLHPSIVDCTFQLIIHLLRQHAGSHSGLTYVPVKMGRVVFKQSTAKPAFAKATLLRSSPHSVTAEFTIFDAQGNAIAVIKEGRFHSIRLSKHADNPINYLDYIGVPLPHAQSGSSSSAITFAQASNSLSELVKRAARLPAHRSYAEEIDPLLDNLCTRFTYEALQQFARIDGRIDQEQISQWTTANDANTPWVKHLFMLAEEDGLLSRDDAGIVLVQDDDQISAQDIWNSLVADYPDYFQIIHTVGRIGLHLPEILEGKRTIAQLLPKASSISALSQQILGPLGNEKLGQTLRDLITKGIDQLPDGRRLGIIEISHGVPTLAKAIYQAIDPNSCDYVFASDDASIIDSAAQLQDDYPHAHIHQITDHAAIDSIQQNAVIAIVTLNFESLEETLRAINFASANLADGGTLILLGHHPSRWIDFVFGAQLQFDHKRTDDNRYIVQRNSAFWLKQLSQLSDTTLFDLSPETGAGAYLIAAKKIATETTAIQKHTTPRSWILLAQSTGDEAKLAELLAKALQETGDIVILSDATEDQALCQLLTETTANYGTLDGVVHLRGLHASSAHLSAAEILALQVTRCSVATALIQACEATATSTTCWMITSGAASHLLPSHAWEHAQSLPLSPDAALWGLGRTLCNEASNYTVRLIDLSMSTPAERAAVALVREFEKSDTEDEIILTTHGARYVPRLKNIAKPFANTQTTASDRNIRLGFEFPGQLRNLRWESFSQRAIAADEVEVDVHATGLNFRDVMYALGLLSDEAIEQGFAGPTLGLEFSGIVKSVGSANTGYSPGDKVVGFGPSSFGSRVITKNSAISHIPPNMSFEAASTIPSTFFTAYYALHHLARVQPGEKVLIHGAAGGVGIAAIQIAKWLGAEIYATVGSEEKRDFLTLLGVEHIHDSRSLSFADEILLKTDNKGVDVVLNSLAGEAINRNFSVLKPFGRFLELGKRDFYENTKFGLRPFRNNLSYFGIDADQLMNANPELTRRLFAEVMHLFTEGVLHPLPYHLFDAENIVDAFRYMQQARQIGKIVVTYGTGIHNVHHQNVDTKHTLSLPENATYLVTGGLGGFGLKTAQWLASKGARNLILVSRSGPASDEAKRAIAEFKAQGVRVHAAACDITDKAAVTALFATTQSLMPPLRGIVHAATVINDSLVRNTNTAQIHSVLAPKSLGALHLHELSAASPLDFFVLYSSATTLFGNPGQANYVAGNLSLESLAVHRLAQGLPATCIRWGAIDDVGFLARNEKIKEALQSRMGGDALHSSIALATLEQMLLSKVSGLGVMETDWKAMSRFLPSMSAPKFSEMMQAGMSGDDDQDGANDIQHMLETMSDEEIAAKLVEMVKVEVGEILRISADKIDPSRSIYDMGLDSLMGVELVVALESRFGIRLPVMSLNENPTIIKLAEFILSKFKVSETDEDNANDMLKHVQQVASQHGADTSSDAMADLAQTLEATENMTSRMIK